MLSEYGKISVRLEGLRGIIRLTLHLLSTIEEKVRLGATQQQVAPSGNQLTTLINTIGELLMLLDLLWQVHLVTCAAITNWVSS